MGLRSARGASPRFPCLYTLHFTFSVSLLSPHLRSSMLISRWSYSWATSTAAECSMRSTSPPMAAHTPIPASVCLSSLSQLNPPMACALHTDPQIFKAYIEMELQLGNIDRCRMLYEKYLQWQPASCPAWAKFAELERSLGETERARAVYELAIGQPLLDTPELLWKAYIDFEIAEGESERTRQLYERLLERTKHVKVWMSYGQFEAQVAVEEEIKAEEEGREADELVLAEQSKDRVTRAREVYERAFEHMRTNAADQKEERVMLLEAWREMERAAGVNGDPGLVEKKMPRRVKRKRPITTEDGTPAGFEEYYDYIFPDEVANQPNLKILEAAYKWKRQKLTMGDEEEGQQESGVERDEGGSGGLIDNKEDDDYLYHLPDLVAMAGGLDVHKNKYIEDWGTRRENLEKIFRFNRRTLSIAALAIVVLPVVVYRGTIAEFRKQEELEGRPQRKFM
ncbi:unnamed protein product [Closterium sp. NIES-54]